MGEWKFVKYIAHMRKNQGKKSGFQSPSLVLISPNLATAVSSM